MPLAYPLTTLAVLLALGVVAWLVDRVLLALEDRGVIFYRRTRLTPGSLGGSLLGPFALLDPGKRHVLERRIEQEEHREWAAQGAPKDPGGPTPD